MPAWTKGMDGWNTASSGRFPTPRALPISLAKRPGQGYAALAWSKRSAKWASKSRANVAITSRAWQATPEPLGAQSAVTGVSKMVSTGCSISPFKKTPVACAKLTASRTLSSCATWRSICSKRNGQPSVASKRDGSKRAGVKTTSTKFSPLKI